MARKSNLTVESKNMHISLDKERAVETDFIPRNYLSILNMDRGRLPTVGWRKQ